MLFMLNCPNRKKALYWAEITTDDEKQYLSEFSVFI